MLLIPPTHCSFQILEESLSGTVNTPHLRAFLPPFGASECGQGKHGCACRHTGKTGINEQDRDRRFCHPFALQRCAYKALVAGVRAAVSHSTLSASFWMFLRCKVFPSLSLVPISSIKKRKHTLYPGLLLQPGHHDYSCCSLFPHHPPEVTEGFRQRPLRGNVGVLLPIAVNVIGVDVITARDACGEKG